jgi:hypothetical protein
MTHSSILFVDDCLFPNENSSFFFGQGFGKLMCLPDQDKVIRVGPPFRIAGKI